MSSALRNLYLFRGAFATVWVALVTLAGSPAHSADTVSVLAGLLLVTYPLSDAAATLVDLHTDTTAQSRLPRHANAATSTPAAVTVAISAVSLPTAMDTVAVWAIISGAIQLAVGARRLGQLAGQWPMIISGTGSIFAGTTFIDWNRSTASALHALAQILHRRAIWYLLTALWLRRAHPHHPPSSRTTP